MASPPPPPPAAPAPTTICALDDDLLREIFLRLPAITSLARAAFACHAFLRAVRSSPTFRRRFRELHAPPLLALFLTPYMDAVVPVAAYPRFPVSGPDAIVSFTNLFQDAAASEWWTDSGDQSSVPYDRWYVSFVNLATDQRACYSPHSQALKIYPKKQPHGGAGGITLLEFHMLHPDGDQQRPSLVVCVHRQHWWAWARVAVFSSRTMEWQVFPDAGPLLPEEGDIYADTTATVVDGFVCWVHTEQGCIIALDTATFQFSRMDLPPALNGAIELGETKDGNLCIVSVHGHNMSIWLRTGNGDGVERFMLHKVFPWYTSIKAIDSEVDKDSMEAQPMVVVDGFVYLSVAHRWKLLSPQWFLTFCLETAEVNLLLKRSRQIPCPFDPYIMTSWPSSLIHNKQDSETGTAGDIFEDEGPMGTDESSSPVLFTALQSFKEAVIDDDNVNFAEIDAFLLDDERNSLLNRITTLESGLASARDRVLRIGSGSDNREGMERGSLWQTWKERLGRACSRFLLLILALFIVKMMSFLLKHAAREG